MRGCNIDEFKEFWDAEITIYSEIRENYPPIPYYNDALPDWVRAIVRAICGAG